jgi:hypothetical protein
MREPWKIPYHHIGDGDGGIVLWSARQEEARIRARARAAARTRERKAPRPRTSNQ